MTPLVSFILPSFNRGEYLEKCVTSVLKQTITELECIIVDDGSTDNTREVAKMLMSRDPRVKYFYKENGGVSSARNLGIREAKGEWIQCLDPDDWIHEDKTRFQLNYLSKLKHKEVVFYCDYERVYLDKNQNILRRESKILDDYNRKQLIQRLLVPDFLADSPFPLLQQCLLIHRSVFQKKMFNEDLKALQDRDFCLDLLVVGVDFIHTPIVGAFYTKHQHNRTNNWSYMKNYYVILYETVISKHKELVPLCQVGIHFLLKEAIKTKDALNLARLLNLMQPPLYLAHNKIAIHHSLIVRLIYWIRTLIPNFVIYEDYRGPRSKKIFSVFTPK
ncbi:glycosyltransferase family 2 protein [Aliinostoc sp. HNIBRCY26]|uniref:glycosyltransferase family 2 protein n=1 Tax=Aliinostoc sp. HNIBRCY26 TaxID=3418997 RepID=UPI003D06051D